MAKKLIRVRREKEVPVTLLIFDGPEFMTKVARKRDAERRAVLEEKKGKELGLLLIGYTVPLMYGVRFPVFGLRRFKKILAIGVLTNRVWEYDRMTTEEIVPEAVGL